MSRELVIILAVVAGVLAIFAVAATVLVEPYRMAALLTIGTGVIVAGAVWASQTFYRRPR